MSPTPVITSEQRSAVIASARAIRMEMTNVQTHLANASLSLDEALSNANPEAAVNYLYVVKLLESLPGVGKVRVRRVMSDMGIAEKRRVFDLEPNQRTGLLKEFGQ